VKTVALERRGEVAILWLDKARGNAIDGDLVDDLVAAADEAAADESVRGIVLASAHPRLFCPGLDLVALSEMDRSGLEAFMSRFLSMVRSLYGFPKPMVAAVSGPAVAGGCILALTADWRVLARGAAIGLNEVKIGLPLPWSVALLVRASVNPSSWTQIALLGRNLADEDALQAGVADELAAPESVNDASLARLGEFVDKDGPAFSITKTHMRSGILSEMKAHDTERIPEFLDAWFAPRTQERIRRTLESLRRSSP
jgi:Delta3-Delta2-enoyl-CoA isomerase